MLFKRTNPEVNRVNDYVNSASQSEGLFRLFALEKGLLKLARKKLSKDELVSWHAMWVATAFRRGDRTESYDRALQASIAFPEEPEIAFALGQESEYRGDIEQMLGCFRKAEFPATSAHHALSMCRYCYLHGQFEEGVRHIQPLLDVYFELRIADTTFLYIRGLPFASVTFATAICLFLLSNGMDEALALIKKGNSELTDHSMEYLIELVKWHMKPGGTIPVTAPNEPVIYDGIGLARRAVWEARLEHDPQSAQRHLARVEIPKESHKWVPDLLLLAQAESMFRAENSEGEERALKLFLSKQPLLFEPNWAFEFGFIEYQERVKRKFWRKIS
jgi:tetratricopeptide (TPR) repeat protein